MHKVDLNTTLSNFIFHIEENINILMKTLLRVLATFLIWLSIVMAFGIGILITLKLFLKFF